ncbi:MAG: bifunctional sugar-1-phosphate nucleotidylyltransferase/acetyltransferase [Candidatus Nanohaloarchaea archaeon]|nr:bifunctional sugar-1-phosphate nucleotidylyltransferase/acetyltransferase [Candidatus Nanohaloarchaea archaeon]
MQAVILAAGASSRFWPLSADRHKCLCRVAGRTLIGHTIASLEEAGLDEVIVVQSPAEDVEQELDDGFDLDVSYVVQEEPRGMAHALRQAEELLDERFFVLTPYRKNTGSFIREMVAKQEEGADAVLIARETETPWKYGVLETDDDRAASIVEKPAKGEEPSDQRVVGMYLLETGFFDYLDRVEEHEYQYEDALDIYMDERDVGVVFTEQDTASIKYPWDLFGVVRDVFDDMERSVSPEADVAESATLDGTVVVEDGATIYENAVIRGPCYVGEDCVVGNNAVVRAYTDLERGVVVGANSEVRGSVIQQDSHTHQAFVGDSLIGRDVRIGAGTVFANRNVRSEDGRDNVTVHVQLKEEDMDTGRDRLGGIVGDGVDIGTQANIMPGVEIGPDSFVGPSTMVRNNVDAGQTVYTKLENVRRER